MIANGNDTIAGEYQVGSFCWSTWNKAPIQNRGREEEEKQQRSAEIFIGKRRNDLLSIDLLLTLQQLKPDPDPMDPDNPKWRIQILVQFFRYQCKRFHCSTMPSQTLAPWISSDADR